MSEHQIITLTTDFGLADAYVGIMKGVILTIAPQVTIVDVSHEVRPQSIAGAAYLLQSAYRYFPESTIHVVVVDPGVGTTRKPVAVRAHRGTFIGPDNGVLSSALADQGALDLGSGQTIDCEAVVMTNERFQLRPVSQTFHGRDVFAPTAAYVANGVPLAEFGTSIQTLQCTSFEAPKRHRGTLYGAIIHIDRFGNAITNVKADSVAAPVSLEVGGRVIEGLAASYQEARVVALAGSTGLLEIAARNASAAETLGIRVGDPVAIRKRT